LVPFGTTTSTAVVAMEAMAESVQYESEDKRLVYERIRLAAKDHFGQNRKRRKSVVAEHTYYVVAAPRCGGRPVSSIGLARPSW